MKHLLLIIIMLIISCYGFSQGGIDHIKNQPYMKRAWKIDCDNPDGDNLTGAICANFQYQKSDSLLVIMYKKLLAEQETDSARKYIILLQKEWRKLRDKHCLIVWKFYEGGNGHAKSAAYLNCLIELTNHRRKELEDLLIDNL